MTRYCKSCDREYRTFQNDESGLCARCEADALDRMHLPSSRDAFAIVLVCAVIFAVLIALGMSPNWN